LIFGEEKQAKWRAMELGEFGKERESKRGNFFLIIQ
jgi:hypothetical protein